MTTTTHHKTFLKSPKMNLSEYFNWLSLLFYPELFRAFGFRFKRTSFQNLVFQFFNSFCGKDRRLSSACHHQQFSAKCSTYRMVSGDNVGGILRVVGRRDARTAPRSVRSSRRGHSVTKLKPALFLAPSARVVVYSIMMVYTVLLS